MSWRKKGSKSKPKKLKRLPQKVHSEVLALQTHSNLSINLNSNPENPEPVAGPSRKHVFLAQMDSNQPSPSSIKVEEDDSTSKEIVDSSSFDPTDLKLLFGKSPKVQEDEEIEHIGTHLEKLKAILRVVEAIELKLNNTTMN